MATPKCTCTNTLFGTSLQITSSGQCYNLIPAPTDGWIYTCIGLSVTQTGKAGAWSPSGDQSLKCVAPGPYTLTATYQGSPALSASWDPGSSKITFTPQQSGISAIVTVITCSGGGG